MRFLGIAIAAILVLGAVLVARSSAYSSQGKDTLGPSQCDNVSYRSCSRIPASNRNVDKAARDLCSHCFPALQFDFLAEERGLGNYLSYYYSGPTPRPPMCP